MTVLCARAGWRRLIRHVKIRSRIGRWAVAAPVLFGGRRLIADSRLSLQMARSLTPWHQVLAQETDHRNDSGSAWSTSPNATVQWLARRSPAKSHTRRSAMPPVSGTTPYRNVLSAAQNRITATIAQIRSSIPHSGEIGTLIEQSVRRHLEEVLPEKVGVSHGFVVDPDGRVSKQMDVVLYDRLNCPRIFSSAGAQMFPVEATFACGEIKTSLSSSTLEESFQKCLSYKKLCRRAYVERKSPISTTTYTLFGRIWPHWQSMFFVIGVEGSAMENLQRCYHEFVHMNSLDTHERVDTVMVLDNKDNPNMLLNVSGGLDDGVPRDGSIDFLPTPGSRLCSYRARAPWSLFIVLLLRYMTNAPLEPVNMVPYGGSDSY